MKYQVNSVLIEGLVAAGSQPIGDGSREIAVINDTTAWESRKPVATCTVIPVRVSRTLWAVHGPRLTPGKQISVVGMLRTVAGTRDTPYLAVSAQDITTGGDKKDNL